jgi:hypothetical protein
VDVATVLGSTIASTDTVESEGKQMNKVLNKEIRKNSKIFPSIIPEKRLPCKDKLCYFCPLYEIYDSF